MPDYLCIINPASDRWRSGKRWEEQVEPVLKARGVPYEVVYTTGPGHAIYLAEKAARSGKYGVIISGGGDGTLNEVVNGLCRAAGEGPTHPLGIFPIGSGNDFASVLQIPKTAQGMVENVLTGDPRSVDVGWVESPDMLGPTAPRRFFINNSGVGFEAQVNLESRRIHRLRGFLIYLVGVFRALKNYRQPEAHIQWDDGEWRGRMLLLTVGNGRRAGGGFWLTPFAEVDDGALDVGIAEAMSRARILRLLPKAIHGRHVDDPAFSLHRTRTLSVQLSIPTPAHTDGEAIIEGTHALHYRVIAGKVRIITDPHRPLATP